jgi:type 1 fimbria pilin
MEINGVNKIGFAVISGLLGTLLSGIAIGKTPMGWGRILMEGSIIETACAIEMNSRDQAIEMITIPITKIAQDGRGIPKPFVIRLINCTLQRVDQSLPDFQLFRVTFDGVPDGNLLGVEGEARGVGLQIKDHSGNIALPGVPLPPAEITPGDKVLHYTMNLVPNNQKLQAGEYRSTVRFKMDYY